MASRNAFTEHDLEPVPGLPAQLPPGENILWQGRPRWTGVALRAMHLRAIGVYFALLAIWRYLALSHDGATTEQAISGATLLLVLGVLPLALLGGYAWASARMTIFTVTNRRLVVRTGVALPMTVNIPFTVIESAGLAMRRDGTGDIVLTLLPGQRVSWMVLWPYTRSFRVLKPQPMLRAMPDAAAAAQILGRALAASAAMPAPRAPLAPAPAAQGKGPAEAMA